MDSGSFGGGPFSSSTSATFAGSGVRSHPRHAEHAFSIVTCETKAGPSSHRGPIEWTRPDSR